MLVSGHLSIFTCLYGNGLPRFDLGRRSFGLPNIEEGGTLLVLGWIGCCNVVVGADKAVAKRIRLLILAM